MNEKCKTCNKKFNSGIWLSSQFADEKVLLFCSKECKKEYLKMELERIKADYPKFYEKIMNDKKDWKEDTFWLKESKNER